MRALKVAIFLGFTFMFIAGLAVGRSHHPAALHPEPRPWLSEQLNLNAEQEVKMKQIWSQAMAHQPDPQRFHDADRQRDEQIRDLLTDQQKAQLDAINAEHERRINELRAQRDQVFKAADEQTRAILTDEQRKKFDEISKDRARRHGGPPMMRMHNRPATQTTPSH